MWTTSPSCWPASLIEPHHFTEGITESTYINCLQVFVADIKFLFHTKPVDMDFLSVQP